MNVIQFPKKELRTYNAKAFKFNVDNHEFETAGTLDGYIDFVMPLSKNQTITFNIDRDCARAIIAALHGAIDDITENCLFERDQLLTKE